jgi:hypothetical protein
MKIFGYRICLHDWKVWWELEVKECRVCIKCGKRQKRDFIEGAWKWSKWYTENKE